MSVIRKLASQTAVYGLSSIIGRFINFLLVPLYTDRLAPGEYGVVTVFFGVVAFFNVILVYGMETAFFNFTRTEHPDKSKVYSTALISIFTSTALFIVLGLAGASLGASELGYPEHTDYAMYCVGFLALDALAALPFSLLRKQERPKRYAFIKLLNIGVNVGLNCFFLLACPWLTAQGYDLSAVYDPANLVQYIFISNLIASAVTLLLLLPELSDMRNGFNSNLFARMMKYAYPLIFVGLAGIVNETLDRILLKRMLPAAEADYQVGIYSAFYKLSMVMTMFVQAFRFAAEPFFFSRSTGEDAKVVYARVMTWFVYVCAAIFLGTMLWIDDLAAILIRSRSYFEDPRGMEVVPILLMANLCLGVYYSLSIWYKLSDRNNLGAWMAVGGALLTIIINVLGIPVYGFMASAWATLIVYAAMMITSYLIGRKYYPVPYKTALILFTIGISLLLWVLAGRLLAAVSAPLLVFVLKVVICIVFAGIVWLIERRRPRYINTV